MPKGDHRLTPKEYAARLRAKGGFLLVPTQPYVDSRIPLEHKCRKCGTLRMVRPANVLASRTKGCPTCDPNAAPGRPARTHQAYVKLMKVKHPLIQVTGIYVHSQTKVEHTCRKCKCKWMANPNDALNIGCGCPNCNRFIPRSMHSKTAIAWLEAQARRLRIKIQHAENGGEHRISFDDGTWCYVDGYNARKRMVFEYHGSAWHGDPAVYKPMDRCHPLDKTVTARELYRQTMARERKMRDAGYVVVSVWESELR